jgi:hypothetical protein
MHPPDQRLDRCSPFERQGSPGIDEVVDDRQFVGSREARRDRAHGTPRLLEAISGALPAAVRQGESGGTSEAVQIVPERGAIDEEAGALPRLDDPVAVQGRQDGLLVGQLVVPGADGRSQEEERRRDEIAAGLEEVRPGLETVRARAHEETRGSRAIREEHQGRRERPDVPMHDPPADLDLARTGRVEVGGVAAELDPAGSRSADPKTLQEMFAPHECVGGQAPGDPRTQMARRGRDIGLGTVRSEDGTRG